MSEHPDIDMISFTGSTRAGIDVAKRAAADRQARQPGARRQVAERHPRRRRPHQGGDRRRDAHVQQLRPVLQRAVAHDRAASKMKEVAAIAKAVADKTKAGDPQRRRHHHRPGRQPHPVGQDPGADQEGHRRGRHARRRRPRPARGRQQGLLCPPDRLRRRHQRHDDRARGDLRTGADHHRRQGRSRRGQDRQRHAVRSRRLRLGRHRSRAPRASAGRSAPATSTCNGVPNERTAPFGGYKQSGNGREWGKYGLEEYLEVKAVAGFNAA